MRALVLLALASCANLTDDFVCDADEDCLTAAGVQGTCEPELRCSIPDSTCTSGQRYTDRSGAFSNVCTGEAAGVCFKQVRAGDTATCALRSDDTVWCWGAGNATPAQRTVPAGPIAELAVAGANQCARYASGTVYCWSGPQTGQLAVPSSRGLAVGPEHGCVITSGDAVACWGSNSRGELGDGTRTPRTASAVTPGVAGAAQIAIGGVPAGSPFGATYATCATLSSGRISCWGDNNRSQLGNGFTTDEDSLVPVLVVNVSDFTAVSVGNQFTCARRSTGAVACWGFNDRGQLGSMQILDEYNTPTALPALANIRVTSSGSGHTVALATDGKVYCWGTNASQQCASPASAKVDPPTAVDTAGLVLTDVDAGGAHTCGRAMDGAIYCWGRNTEGQLGTGAFADSARPVKAAVACR